MPPGTSGSLGRGLGDLMEGMPTAIGVAQAQSGAGFLRLSPEAIGLPPERVARAVSEALVQSVREHGVLQPILVRRRQEGYEVVAGARRLAAARLAGVAEIPAVVIIVSDEESEKLSAIENTCREPIAAPAAVPSAPVELSPPVEPVPPVEPLAAVAPSAPVDEPVPVAAPAPVEPLVVMTPPAPTKPPAVVAPPGPLVVEQTVTVAVAKPRRWTPGRIGLAVGYGGAALVIGVLLGGRRTPQTAQPRHPVLPPPPVTTVVTQILETVRTVEVRPPLRAVDGAEIVALGWDGLRVESLSNGVIRVVVGRPLFRTRTVLAGEDALKQLGAIFRRHPDEWRVTVVGHTDALPFTGTGACRDNRELGLARATEVVRYLMRDAAVPAAMLQAGTAGENDPPFSGDDEAARLKNRTVSFRISRAP